MLRVVSLKPVDRNFRFEPAADLVISISAYAIATLIICSRDEVGFFDDGDFARARR